MLTGLFESRFTRAKDLNEISGLRARYGDDLVNVVRERVRTAPTERDRKHWQRIARKI